MPSLWSSKWLPVVHVVLLLVALHHSPLHHHPIPTCQFSMHNYPLPRADVEDSQSAIAEDSPQVEVVDDTPQVAHHNLASYDVDPPANLFDTPPPIEVETRAPLLVVRARVGDEAGVGAAFC